MLITINFNYCNGEHFPAMKYSFPTFVRLDSLQND